MLMVKFMKHGPKTKYFNDKMITKSFLFYFYINREIIM